jgi:hypothetical protein
MNCPETLRAEAAPDTAIWPQAPPANHKQIPVPNNPPAIQDILLVIVCRLGRAVLRAP